MFVFAAQVMSKIWQCRRDLNSLITRLKDVPQGRLRFCTINAVQVEKAVVHTQDLNLQWTVLRTVALPLGEYVSFFD